MEQALSENPEIPDNIYFCEPNGRYYYVCPLDKCGRSHYYAYYDTPGQAQTALDAHLEVCRGSRTPMTFTR